MIKVNTILRAIIIYLIGINILTFLVFGIDKWKARRGKWRIPEATLIGMSIAGGSIAWDENACWQIHECLLNKIKKEREYVADFSAYKDMYVGLPYNIPFVFRKK